MWAQVHVSERKLLGFLKIISFNIWLCWVFLAAGAFSLAVRSGPSLFSCDAQASLVAGPGLWSRQAFIVVVPGLRYPAACEIFRDQGSNLSLLLW